MPRTCVSRATMASSSRVSSVAASGTTPEIVCAARSLSAAAFAAEKPTERSASGAVSRTCSGVGKATPCAALPRESPPPSRPAYNATKRARMASAALPLICCEAMACARCRNGEAPASARSR